MPKNFKDRLKDEIEYQGFSCKSFAEKIGISINTLNMYIYRDSIPAADVAVQMAQVLNTSVEYLVTGKSDSKNSIQLEEIKNIVGALPKNKLADFIKIARAYKSAVLTF